VNSGNSDSYALSRRPVLKLLTGGALAVTGVGVGVARLSSSDGADDSASALLLSSQDDTGVDSLDIPLDSRRLATVGEDRWQTRQLPASTHSMVAVTWIRGTGDPRVRIRSRKAGEWQDWQTLPPLHDLPDPGSEESTTVAGTDLVWIGAADGIQVDVSQARPDDLTLVLLHPAQLPSTTALAQRSGSSSERMRQRVPRPELRLRRDWGARRRWRSGDPSYNNTIRQVHVHHTVNSNSYSRADVPGLIRGMYRYHTKNLGWSDLGYNFLVDRFGRIWVGRAGGARRPVRGAHTLGFNGTSVGVSVIGNFETTKPNRKVVRSVAALAAWKLDRYGRNPRGRTRITSEGSDNYPAGRRVRLPVIDGHRDTNDTACPGRYLYEALPRIRRRAKRIMASYPAE
jgi:hypothetical protein